ncbi:aminotransferase class I/II-fold pyridoxal phosphate-dependent enzyme [Evansella halocellulosilytica]|uniref:aminotransferase class I/II-fold pyridoxal phosphate-dependent enzyme n=1 Tax=Evansella halocellulosilytica TaxID=2011013 RepID=UPI0015CC92B2|nr:aminotransferase class I/II-fold pyridoxal phosphate-dependent enzyme [Evansella halocellulosilytica]
MDQFKTPLYDQLMTHVDKAPLSYHVPGHKNGKVFHKKGQNVYEAILQLDVTEISGMDDLHNPSGVIKEAQQLAADLYEVDHSFFLVGGSTVGNLAMILSVVQRGDTVLVQRNSHQSIFHGIELSGAKPVFLEPEIDSMTGLPLGVSVEVVEEAIQRYPEASALILTNPTYEGYGQSLKKHVAAAHKVNIPVLVDEAHGAHFVFNSESWPESAIKAGADIIVHSAHKMLPSMTMTSFLHIQNERVEVESVSHYLKVLQSSSPSYPLLASLDLARAYLYQQKIDSSHEEVKKEAITFKQHFQGDLQWKSAPEEVGAFVQDPLKVLLFSPFGANGYELRRQLETLQIFAEFSTRDNVLFTLPLSTKIKNYPVTEMVELFQKKNETKTNPYRPIIKKSKLISEATCLPEEIRKIDTFLVPYEKAVGYIAAETITPYPPGVPLIFKGEMICEEQCSQLKRYDQAHSYFQTGDKWRKQGILVVNLHR